MNININYKNKIKKIKINPLESILNIKSRFLGKNKDLDNYDLFLDNQKLKNHDYLDKIKLNKGCKFYIYTKKMGGSNKNIAFYKLVQLLYYYH